MGHFHQFIWCSFCKIHFCPFFGANWHYGIQLPGLFLSSFLHSDRKHNTLRHFNSMHARRPEKPLACCGVAFSDKQTYVTHQQTVHAKGYTCPTCGVQFETRSHFVLHNGVHDRARNQWCACGYNTSRAVSVSSECQEIFWNRISVIHLKPIFVLDSMNRHGRISRPFDWLFDQLTAWSIDWLIDWLQKFTMVHPRFMIVWLPFFRKGNFKRHLDSHPQHKAVTSSREGTPFSYTASIVSGIENVRDKSSKPAINGQTCDSKLLSSDSLDSSDIRTLLENNGSSQITASSAKVSPMPFRCEKCGDSFSMLKFLWNHKVTHAEN